MTKRTSVDIARDQIVHAAQRGTPEDLFTLTAGQILELFAEPIAAMKSTVNTCPVCGQADQDGLEACAKCYTFHFQRSLRLHNIAKSVRDIRRNCDVDGNPELEAAVIEIESQIDDL